MRNSFIRLISLGIGLTAIAVAVTSVQAQPYDPRIYTISNSYGEAFCRNPSPGEVTFWLSDPRSSDYKQIMDGHRQYLRQDQNTRNETIRKSYLAIFHRDPSEGERVYWDGVVAQNGFTCKELEQYHTTYRYNNPGAR